MMIDNFQVGVVWSVSGVNLCIKMFNTSSDFKYFYKGKKYEGIRNGGYLIISRGTIDIVCQVESEEIKDKLLNKEPTLASAKDRYERFVYAKCIGYFEDGKFKTGNKYTPIIYNVVSMLDEETIKRILAPTQEKNNINFEIGVDLQYNLKISLPWTKIFNTHIGIFGNTGSGKSNTLARLYSTLFSHEELDVSKSKFIFIDFNNEYINESVLFKEKTKFILSTKKAICKFPIEKNFFWDAEVLSILFHATEKTQKPFLKKLIQDRESYINLENALEDYLKSTIKKLLTTTNPKKELKFLLERIFEILSIKSNISKLQWHSKQNIFWNEEKNEYFHGEPLTSVQEVYYGINDIQIKKLSPFQELEIRARLLLTNGVMTNFNQYEHINPLINSISTSIKDLDKIIEITDSIQFDEKNIEVISLRECNQSMKKIFPILLAKQAFEYHKNAENKRYQTFHLIIDEAHNILSTQSNREAETWKDYRLELFEEIIKEGRKFGFFLTVASQRPADISETLMSQFHNFFIHRLINEKDLKLIDNVISTLDRGSKSMIPSLPQGACIVTGTAFDIPKIIQVAYIEEKEKRPSSDDIDLFEIWKKPKECENLKK